jgi:predicted nucleic acid-binding protein
LGALIEEQDNEVLASNQVIGEAFATITHHYGATEEHARSSLFDVLTSGLVAPMNGRSVLDALSASDEPGLFDRLIANDYARAGLETLTLDRRMATLPTAAHI